MEREERERISAEGMREGRCPRYNPIIALASVLEHGYTVAFQPPGYRIRPGGTPGVIVPPLDKQSFSRTDTNDDVWIRFWGCKGCVWHTLFQAGNLLLTSGSPLFLVNRYCGSF